MNGSGRNNYAGLGFDLMLLVADPRKSVAVDFEEDQYFFRVVPMQRCPVVISHFSYQTDKEFAPADRFTANRKDWRHGSSGNSKSGRSLW